MTTPILSVLIVEPNALQCDLIKLAMTRGCFGTIVCRQPSNLQQLMHQHQPDVLVIDTYLPEQNGLDLLGQLQLASLPKKPKVFVVSAMGFPEIVQKAAQMGANGFFVKPLDPELLVSRILSFFPRQGQLAAQAA